MVKSSMFWVQQRGNCVCVKNDMESLGLSQNMCSSRINGKGELRGQPANPGLPGKWPIKQCV